MTDKIFCAHATELLQEATKDNFSGAEVECAICQKRTKKAGLTLFKWYTGTNKKVWWKNKVLFCDHLDWDGASGCDCCHTIRNGLIVCGTCAGWDLLSGSPTPAMKGNNFTWTDGSNSSWKLYPEVPLKQYKCTVCQKIECFRHDKAAHRAGWSKSAGYQCPNHKTRKRPRDEISELKAEIGELKTLILQALNK